MFLDTICRRIPPVQDTFVMVNVNGKVSYFNYEKAINRQETVKRAVSNLHNCLSDVISKRHREYEEVMSMILPITKKAALGIKPLTLEDIDKVNIIIMKVLNSKKSKEIFDLNNDTAST